MRSSIAAIFGIALSGVLATGSLVHAEEAAAPDPDAVLQQLVALDPSEVAAYMQRLKGELAALEKASAELKKQADAKTEEATAIAVRLAPFVPKPAPAPEAMAAAPSEMEKTEATEAMAPPKYTYQKDVMAIFAKRCVECHNDGKRRGGLAVNTFSMLMEGGSSGSVISPGDADGSRLVRLIEWEEEPIMPPEGDPLTDEQIALIREWINLGAPENEASKVMLAKAPAAMDTEIYLAAEIKDGPPPMPEVELEPVRSRTPRSTAARAMATSPTAPLLAVGGDRQVLLYSLDDYSLLGALSFPEGDVFTLTFSVNGELLLAGGGQEGDSAAAVLWEVRQAKRMGTYQSGFDTVLAAEISPDHRIVVLGGPDRRVRAFDTASGTQLYELDKHTDWVYAAKITPDGELLATADRAGNLLLWQAANGRFVEALRGHEGAIHDLAYTLDSNILASAGHDGQVILWDTWKYSSIRKVKAHNTPALSVEFSPDGSFVSSARNGETKRWGLDGKEQHKYEALPDWAYQTSFGAKGAVVVTGDWSGQLAVWKSEDGARLATLTTNPEAPAAADAKVASAATSGGGSGASGR